MKTIEEYKAEFSAISEEFNDEITENVLGEFTEISVAPVVDFTKFDVTMLNHENGSDLGSRYTLSVDLRDDYNLKTKEHTPKFNVSYCHGGPLDATDELEIKKLKIAIALAERTDSVRTIVTSFESRLKEFRSRLFRDYPEMA